MTTHETAPLNQYLEPIVAHKKLIALVALLAIAAAVGAGLAVPKQYGSTASILVYPVDADPTEVLGADQEKVDMSTEIRIATSQTVADGAAEQLKVQSVNISAAALEDGVTASSPKESSILDITFVAPTAAKAQAGTNAIANAYLDFRANLATDNKRAAETALTQRIAVLNQRLNGGDPVDTVVVEAELAAQQAALANLSTLTVDAATVIDQASFPEAPQGLTLIQLVVGAVAGGLALGVISAYAASAMRAPAPTTGARTAGAASTTSSGGSGSGPSDGRGPIDGDPEGEQAKPTVDVPDLTVVARSTPSAPTPLPLDRQSGPSEQSAAREAVAAYERSVPEAESTADDGQPAEEQQQPEDESVVPVEAATVEAGADTSVDSTDTSATEAVSIFSSLADDSSKAEAETDSAGLSDSELPRRPKLLGSVPSTPDPTGTPDPTPSQDRWSPPQSPEAAPGPVFDWSLSGSDEAVTEPVTEPTPEPVAIESATLVDPLEPMASEQAPTPAPETPALAPEPVEAPATPELADAPEPVEAPATPVPAITPEPVEAPQAAAVPQPIEAPEPVVSPQPIEAPEASAVPEPIEVPQVAVTPEPIAASEPVDAAIQTPTGPDGADRRELVTIQAPEGERRALHITGSQRALVATPELDDLIEHLQKLGRSGPVVGLTLGEEGVGTSIAVAFDLADALQSLGARVLLVDAATNDPMLANLLSVEASPGLAEVLTGQAPLRSAVRSVGGLKGLDALPLGTITDSTVPAIAGAPFERLLAEAKVDYHSILIISETPADTVTVPALAALSDGLIVGTTQAPGQSAGRELCNQLASLPAPTLEFLSEMLVVERADGAVVVGSSSM